MTQIQETNQPPTSTEPRPAVLPVAGDSAWPNIIFPGPLGVDTKGASRPSEPGGPTGQTPTDTPRRTRE